MACGGLRRGRGVFSPKKGATVLEARARGAGGGVGGPRRGFTGTLRGNQVMLPGVKGQKMAYTKRPTAVSEALRKKFESTRRFTNRSTRNPGPVAKNRANFLKGLANDPSKEAALRAAGIDDAGIQNMKLGRVPDPDIWQVHHKFPLDDGGTNADSNLVLMRNEPYHKTITTSQKAMTAGMNAGDTRILPAWPVPDGFVYPPEWPIPSNWPPPPPLP